MTGVFNEYFVKPVIERTGYNTVNTLFYGLLLVIGAYALFKFFKKIGITINLRFFKHSTPFILFVSVWRALTDAGIYPYNFFTTTPGLYVPVLIIFFPLIYLSKKIEQAYKIPYWKIYSGISLALLLSQLVLVRIIRLDIFFLIIYFTLISCLPFILLFAAKKIKNKLNLLILLTHMFDATATHVSINYLNKFGQHVVPRLMINLFGSTIGFYLLKLIILIPLIFLLNKYDEDKELNDWIRIVFITYGLATGTRGFISASI